MFPNKTESVVQQIHDKYPFGDWVNVSEVKKIAYTGRTIELDGDEIIVSQTEFFNGRMNHLSLKKHKNGSRDDPCNEIETADFTSGVGDLHWVTSQTRVDHTVDTSRLQKRQNKPTHGGCLDLSRVVKEVKQTAEFSLRVRYIKDPVVGAWADSALCGAEGELLDGESDTDLAAYDKHNIFSHRGAFLALLPRAFLEDVGDVPISIMD